LHQMYSSKQQTSGHRKNTEVISAVSNFDAFQMCEAQVTLFSRYPYIRTAWLGIKYTASKKILSRKSKLRAFQPLVSSQINTQHSGSQPFLMHSSLCSFSNFSFLPNDTKLFLFLPYYTSLQKYLIFQYILSHLLFTCHGVASSS